MLNWSGSQNGSSTLHRPIRWRWYHYYFLLAVFDLVVIITSLGLYIRL